MLVSGKRPKPVFCSRLSQRFCQIGRRPIYSASSHIWRSFDIWLRRRGFSRIYSALSSCNIGALKADYSLNLVCLLLKRPEYYLPRLRHINSSLDFAVEAGRESALIQLRNVFEQPDLIKFLSSPVSHSTHPDLLDQSAEKSLQRLRSTVEGLLDGKVVEDDLGHDNCCLICFLCSTQEWSVLQTESNTEGHQSLLEMFEQPMNSDEFLDLLMFPRSGRFLSAREGRNVFDQIRALALQEIAAKPYH